MLQREIVYRFTKTTTSLLNRILQLDVLNYAPFVGQYGILNNKWGVLLWQKGYRIRNMHPYARIKMNGSGNYTKQGDEAEKLTQLLTYENVAGSTRVTVATTTVVISLPSREATLAGDDFISLSVGKIYILSARVL